MIRKVTYSVWNDGTTRIYVYYASGACRCYDEHDTLPVTVVKFLCGGAGTVSTSWIPAKDGYCGLRIDEYYAKEA